MKWVAVAVLALMTLAIAITIRAANDIHIYIDRCDDQTSCSYIWDDATRRSECRR